ncbi:tyrosine-protein phosphatase [Propionicicella superfundia]|uniref:tyrosine-protein phosphatase n=1 Tax=Propionicicella superfundia TaxID=348582 RepID=UPI0004209285|nr:tyrosine-protein phosphatase [Propionicicella superfundia]
MTGWIELDGLDNLRDLGGLRTSGGAEIVPGRLWRSDNLQSLTAADVSRLHDLGLSDVVDLRSGFEIRSEGPTPLAGQGWVTYHWHSLVPEEEEQLPDAAVPLPEDASTLLADPVAASYLGYITERPRAILDAMRVVGTAHGAALVHCAAGKDRTGTVVALALGALGVARDDIVADYALTTERIGPVVERMRQARTYTGRLDDVPLEMFHARPEVMAALLDVTDDVWGGVGPLLTAMGWSAADQNALEDRLLG